MLGANMRTQATPTCLVDCFWENILTKFLKKFLKKNFKNLEFLKVLLCQGLFF
jgi:hypothetical protein